MTELPGLIVDVEARIDKLEKGLKKANQVQRRTSTQMERRAKQSADRMSASYSRAGSNIAASFGKLGPALVAGLSVGAVNQITGRIRSVVKEVAGIGDAAKTAGVSVEAFQELSYVSDQSRITVSAMTDALKELSLRADEFIQTGSGPGAEAFQRLGFNAAQLAEGLKEPDKLFEEIIEKMEDLDDAAKLRIADEIFGGTGAEQLSALIDKGAASLRTMRQEARDSGAVLDSEVIRKAEELDRKFEALTIRIQSFFKRFAVGAADIGTKIATLRTDLEDLTSTMQRAENLLGENTTLELSTDQGALDASKDTIRAIVAEYHRLGEAADQLTGPLFQAAARLAAIGEADAAAELNRIATEMRSLVGDLNDGTISAETFETRIEELATAAQTALAEISAIDGVEFTGVTAALGGFVKALGTAIARARELRAALPGANPGGVADPTVSNPDANDPRGFKWGGQGDPSPRFAPKASIRPNLPGVDSSFGTPPPSIGGGGGGGGGSARQSSELQREIAAIAQETNALRLEAQAIAEVTGKRMAQGDALEFARAKAELLAAAQRSGVAVTPELTAQLDEMARGYVAAGLAAEEAANKITEIQNAGKAGADRLSNMFEGLITGAVSAKEAVGQLILEVLKLTLKKKLLEFAGGAGGAGGGGGFFGTFLKVLGGGLGMPFAEGGYTGAGGKYQPAGVVHKGEYVMSKAATSAIGVGNLEAMHNAAKKGYAGGGLVTAPRTARGSSKAANSPAAPSVTISAPITVNGSAGTPEQNTDLAQKMAKQFQETIKGEVVGELSKQMRPGNLLNRRSQ